MAPNTRTSRSRSTLTTGGATVYANKTVIESVDDELHEISLEDARKFDDSVQLGEIFQIDITPPNFGRIATQRARQVMQQALRDAEASEVYTQFIEHEGEILVGRGHPRREPGCVCGARSRRSRHDAAGPDPW